MPNLDCLLRLRNLITQALEIDTPPSATDSIVGFSGGGNRGFSSDEDIDQSSSTLSNDVAQMLETLSDDLGQGLEGMSDSLTQLLTSAASAMRGNAQNISSSTKIEQLLKNPDLLQGLSILSGLRTAIEQMPETILVDGVRQAATGFANEYKRRLGLYAAQLLADSFPTTEAFIGGRTPIDLSLWGQIVALVDSCLRPTLEDEQIQSMLINFPEAPAIDVPIAPPPIGVPPVEVPPLERPPVSVPEPPDPTGDPGGVWIWLLLILAIVVTLIALLLSLESDPADDEEKDDDKPCPKSYPNLRPGDLQHLADDTEIVITAQPPGRRGLNGGYLYVVIDGRLILGDVATATRLREPGFELHHPDLVNGANVAYGGNIRFHNSTVSYWDRDSGHYEPNRLGDRAESECIREIIEQAPGWSLGTLPPETLIDFS